LWSIHNKARWGWGKPKKKSGSRNGGGIKNKAFKKKTLSANAVVKGGKKLKRCGNKKAPNASSGVGAYQKAKKRYQKRREKNDNIRGNGSLERLPEKGKSSQQRQKIKKKKKENNTGCKKKNTLRV